MSEEDEKFRQEAASEAARLARIMTEQVIPLFPPSYKLVIMGRDEDEDVNGSSRIFLTNEPPEAMVDLLAFLRKNMTACAALDKQTPEKETDGHYVRGFKYDDTIN